MSLIAGKRVAIANRGEIAVRIAATCQRLGAIPILLLGESDRDGFAARQVGRVEIAGAAGSELDVALVIAAAGRAGADFLHPGYGFLSERASLAGACEEAGIVFVGPAPATLLLCGDKLATRQAAADVGVPVLPASRSLSDNTVSWLEVASEVGYPLLVKPAGAGGGRGLRRVAEETGLLEAVHASRRESASSGAGNVVYLERELIDPRHVEVQVAGDGIRTLALGDRDCSVQRRHQKVIEEAPAPHIDLELRRRLHGYAERIGEATGLRGIATCEFLLGADGTLAFLEVNPRIQVEHPVTELVTGIDLVEWQLTIAAGGSLPLNATPEPRGHAIEARVYAEDPWNGFFPVAGALTAVSWPSRPDLRIDAGYETGDTIPNAYDPLIAKLIAHGSDRSAALAALEVSLLETVVAGIPTNLPWLRNLLDYDTVRSGHATTRTASEVEPELPDRLPSLLGALAHTLEGGQKSATDPWPAIGPFRFAGRAPIVLHGDDWEESIAVARMTDGWNADSCGITVSFRWWRGSNGIWTILAGDSVMRVAVVERNGSLEVSGHGGRWIVRHGAKPAKETAKHRRAHDGRIRAPLPSKVLGVHVAVGDQVLQGQSLVTLTAMKIEMICEAPAAGLVESISCKVDDQVDSDQVMITLKID